ncbi:MAG: GyrI-like domain-containing protein [Limisphaerales bacterium]
MQLFETAQYEVARKAVPAQLIGGIRMTGRYQDCGKAFGTLGRKLNRHIGGKALTLYYDGEYKETDADFEPAMPVKCSLKIDGICVRELPGCEWLTLMHKGPYEELGRSYRRMFGYLRQRELKLDLPTREVYRKGPGMIFKGNPNNYLTEIQFPVAAS